MTGRTFARYDAYKDSGVEWLGEVPGHWEVKRLKDLGDSIIGITYSPDDVVEDDSEGILVLRASNIQNGKLSLSDNVYVSTRVQPKHILRQGDILLCSRSGSRNLIGKNICIDETAAGCTFGAFMTVYRSKYAKFISKFFNSQLFESQSGLFASSTVNQLTINTLRNFAIALPPLPEQRAIAAYLDTRTATLDRQIALLTQKAAHYAGLKQSLINQTVTHGPDPAAPMKDSGIEWIGEIPAHWEVKRVNDISVQSKRGNTGLIEKNLLSLSYGKIVRKDFDTRFGLLPASFETYQIVEAGNIILRLTDLQNDQRSLRVGLVKERGIITSAYLCLRLQKSVDPAFAYYLLFVYDISKVFYWFGAGLRQSMKFADVKVFPFVLPPLPEQRAIAAYLDERTAHIDRIVETINAKIAALRELRQTLINDVVTGKIKVCHA